MQLFKYPKLWWLKFVIALSCFSLDYLTKDWARNHLHLYGSEPFIPNFLRLTLVTNSGAAFNLGSNHALLMTVIATTVTLLLIIWVLKEDQAMSGKSNLIGIAAGFLIGGALGNLSDRFLRGRVTDFLEFTFVSFPVFNLADIFIDVGVGLIIILALKNKSAAKLS